MPLFNVWAIVASMIVSVGLGFVWYGPLFGKQWMKLAGITMPDQKPSMTVMIKPIILALIGSGIMSYAFSALLAFHNAYYNTTGYVSAFAFAFFIWLGFMIQPYLNLTGWEGKPWKLFLINAGYWLVLQLCMAAIIVALY